MLPQPALERFCLWCCKISLSIPKCIFLHLQSKLSLRNVSITQKDLFEHIMDVISSLKITTTADMSFCQTRCPSNYHKFHFCLKAIYVLMLATFLSSASSSTVLYVIPFVRCYSFQDTAYVFVTLILP